MDFDEQLTAKVETLAEMLVAQVERAYGLDDTTQNHHDDPRLPVHRLLKALPQIRAAVDEDKEIAFEHDPAARNPLEIALAYRTVRALAVHRCAHELYCHQVPLISRIMSEYAAQFASGLDIHPGATISPRIFIDHGVSSTIRRFTTGLAPTCTGCASRRLGITCVRRN